MNSPAARRYGAAALAGILLSLAFAPAEIAGAAWVAPGLILFCALGATGATAFRVGFVAGWAHFLTSLYWLLAMPFTWHGIPLAPGLAWLALSAYCALFFALWVWFCWRIFPGDFSLSGGTLLSLVESFLSVPVWQRAIWAVLCASAWTALEFTRGLFLSGFPWNPLGASQYRLLPVIQVASITGVYGVTFLAVWFSVAIASAMLVLARYPGIRQVWGDAALPLLTLTWVVGYGMNECLSAHPPSGYVKMALVQPSIPQTLIFDPAEDAERFADVIALSEKALESNPDILVWPESAIPGLTEDNQRIVSSLLERHSVWLLCCADSSDMADGILARFNSSFLVNPKGAIKGIYHKRRLVIFGEYIPLRRWLPFLHWLAPEGDDFSPGDHVTPFNLTNLNANISPLICFEDAFPQEARAHVGPETDFLVNLTNDGWFGDGPEQKQHAVMAVFRAVENGVPLVRCTNNGLTCWIDAQGRLREVLDPGGSIYGQGFLRADIPLRGANRKQTFYNRHGDLFAWVCCGISILAMAVRARHLSSSVGGAVS
jgi:apolipoprotein N-acyltransferase